MNMQATSGFDVAHWRDALDRVVSEGATPGLVALAAVGDTVEVHAAGVRSIDSDAPMTRDTLFRIASMTKPVAATAAMALVADGRIALDEPVDPWLPELANRRVLKRLDGPLDDAEPARRPITVRDLLTLRMGLGHIMAPCADYPIRRALDERGLLLGIPDPQQPPPPDEWMARVGELPLMHHPGERWMYDLGLDVLGVLIARVSGVGLDRYLRERILGPLGMTDTGFFVPEAKLDRLSASHECKDDTGAYVVHDGIEDSAFREPPAFPAAASGLVSTVDDYLAFCRMLLNGGRLDGEPFLPAWAVTGMTTDQLTEEQRAANEMFFGKHAGWGLGLSVNLGHGEAWQAPGSFGWVGGRGTSAYTDPKHQKIGVLMTNRNMDSPDPPPAFAAFWGALYR